MAKEPVKKIGKKMGKKEAKSWVKEYQKQNPDAQVKGWLFGRDIIEQLCSNDKLEGIWFFKGLNEGGEERLVMFPADADGNILEKKIKSLGAAAAMNGRDDDDDAPADDSQMCPPFCPDNF